MDDTTVETVQNDIVESAPVETRSARLQNLSTQPDYSIPELYTTDMAFKESTMQLTTPEIENLVRNSGLKGSRWEQTGVAVENALTGMNNLRDEMRITVGNLANAISGGSVGQELQDLGYRNIDNTMSSMQLNEDSVGGVTDLVAKLVGGATSFTQLAAESIISAGVLPLAHIGIQTYGEGAYNDMKKYEEEHGSLEGYKPESVDVAINLLNSAFQVGSEAWLGVGSPRFLRGWSRGAWKEGLSGFAQESIQGAVNDFAEIAKGNKEFSDMLDSADDYLVDGVIGAVLQGGLGAATYSTARRKSDNIIARAHAIAKGRKTPNREDFDIAKKLNDAKEREYASVLTTEFKAQFDASTGEGKLQQNIANAINKAVQAKELDLDTESETDLAQKLEAIATQETMNAMEMAAEQGKSVSEMELNNIVYKDGAIWLEGETPDLGERAVDYAKVLAARQTGLEQAQKKLDNLNAEIQQTQQDLDAARAVSEQGRVERLQKRLDKQKAAEQNAREKAEELQRRADKLAPQIEARLAEQEQVQAQEIQAQEVAPATEMPSVETATETQATVADAQALKELARIESKPVVRTSLKKERAVKKTQTGITRKLDADSKFVKVTDKPSNVDFSDGKEYADSSKRYLLNKVIIKEQDGNLYFKLTGGKYAPTSYVVIEDYTKTDPYEIFSAQVEEGKELGDHFDRAVQDFYERKGLWSLAEPVKLRSWEEYMKDTGQVGGQDNIQATTQVTPQVDEASLEQYDPRKQYNKYDTVRVRTQSGEHIGVWDGSRMTLHETIEEAQDFIKNDIEREEADKLADERRAAAKKEESEKQERAFIMGQGPVEMPYIIQLLKDNDMWEGLSLREKGNFNAIGRVMFYDGRMVNAFGNENSKKGTKVTQNTLNTIQKLRDKLNQVKTTAPTVEDAELLHQGEGIQSPNVAPQIKEQFDLANENARLDDIYPAYDGETIEVDGKERTVYNSNGDRIAKSKEALTNFWRWFGDSKVVDKQRRPLVVYHGSKSVFDTFDNTVNQTKERQMGADLGYFFTDSEYVANKFRTKEQQLEEAGYYIENTVREPITEEKYDAQGRYLGSVHYTKATLPPYKNFGLYKVYLKAENIVEYQGESLGVWDVRESALKSAKASGKDGMIIYKADTGGGIANEYIVFEPNQIKSVYNRGTYSADTGNILKQSKVEGTGSDKYRGGYDEKLKRIILGEKSDLTTIQHEFAHYWMQNNFKWARSGLASQDWLRRWRDVEEALGIEPQDRYLSRQASEKFARAYERYIMEGKVADDLKWAFDGFQKFYQDTYEDLENEYFDLSEELDPKIVDWFNRQRPVTEEQLKKDAYKRVAEVAMSQGAEIITETGNGNYVVSSMNKDGEVVSDVVVDNQQAQQSKLAKFRDTQKSRSVVEGLRESNPNIKSDQYNVLNRAETVDQARQWISNDRAGAWQALNSDSTNIIDRTALFQAFKELAENGDYSLGAELASIKFPKQMTEVGQALSVLGERAEFDPLTILETKQKSLGEPTAEDVATQINEMGLDTELTVEQVQELENTTECAL